MLYYLQFSTCRQYFEVIALLKNNIYYFICSYDDNDRWIVDNINSFKYPSHSF